MEPSRYVIRVPELYSGQTMGQLTSLGAEVDGVNVEDAIWIITASFRQDVAHSFESWLLAVTNGEGALERE